MILVQVQQFGTATRYQLKFYTSVTKGLKLKVREFLGLIPTLVELTGVKLAEGWGFLVPTPYPEKG